MQEAPVAHLKVLAIAAAFGLVAYGVIRVMIWIARSLGATM